MHNIHIFISYTLRGYDVNYSLLETLKLRLQAIENLDVYIDILDNDSTNHQARVFDELIKADVVCVIQSSQINNSIWVKKELKFASQNNIPVLILSIQDIKGLLIPTQNEDLTKNTIIKKIVSIVSQTTHN